MDTLYGIISMTRSERQLPRVSLEDLYITDVIQTLRGVATRTDINAPRYCWKQPRGAEPYVTDNMEEAQTIRFQVMSVLTDYPHHMSLDFRNISGVKRWVRR